MLLTFPNKDSLLRKIKDSDSAQKYLIVANYRALKDWNLIPLNEMTVLLGPNSSGKSSVFEALDGLRMLVDGIRSNSDDNRVDRHYDSQRDESSPHCIGFSAAYPTINQSLIKALCAQSSADGLMRDIDVEVEDDTFPILSRLLNDADLRGHLKDTTYTFIIEELTDEDLDLSVYLDGEFAAKFRVQNIDQQVIFAKKFIKLFINDSELLVNIFDSEDEFIKLNYRVGRWQAFSESPSYVYFPVPYEPAYTTVNDEIYGLIIAFFHAPINLILNSFRKKVTHDVRTLTSDWEFCRREMPVPLESYLAQTKLNSKSSRDFPNSLISDEIDVALGWLDATSSKLNMLNRWLKEPAFMGTPYQVEIQVKACIPLGDLSEPFILRSKVKRDSLIGEAGIEYLGRAYLRDSEGRLLLFSDVGAGFSQVIPILVALTSDTTILYKQPEVHLHPKLQSKVADCFIETVNRENIFKNSFRIVETHSEHFILRLLRRVRESFGDELLHSSLTLQTADFSLVYFQPKGDHSEIHQIRVAESGEFIDAWPDGFFDERDEDIWGSSQWGST
jgi:energy-coupling factor transporter ATP-binding protein EcfA2